MQKLQSRIDGVNTPRVGYIAISRVYHIFAKNVKLSDLIKFALLQYGGCGLRFCTAFRISPSGAISGWIIGEIRQHQNFDCGPYRLRYPLSIVNLKVTLESLNFFSDNLNQLPKLALSNNVLHIL